MSEPAKDDAELLEQIAKEVLCDGIIICNNRKSCVGGCFAKADAALAAIRAAGWAVVPVALMEQAVDELEENASGSYPHRDAYPEEMRRYERDMELPRAIRAMLAAAPGVKS